MSTTENSIEENEEYKIHESRKDWFDAKFEKMNRVAIEVNAKPSSYKIVREEFKERKKLNNLTGNYENTGLFDKYYIITVEGESPKLKGWSFIASITHTKNGNLINKVPGIKEDVPNRYRIGNPNCDYCNIQRYRVDSFIVKSDKGEYKQIGRNCLAKFLGYSDPNKIAQYATWLDDLKKELTKDEEDDNYNNHHDSYRDLESFLTMVAAVKNKKGWVSATQAQATGKLASIVEVNNQLFPDFKETERNPKIVPTEEDHKEALKAIEFARSNKLTDDTDYKHNLKISTSTDMFHEKASGIVASLISFKEHNDEYEILQAKRKAEAEEKHKEYKKSEYIGNEGEKITVKVLVTRQQNLDSQFGVTYMYRMVDKDNNIFVWFASNNILKVDKWYNLTGTIKKHEMYKDIKQNILTRCKIVEEPKFQEKEFETAKRKITKSKRTEKYNNNDSSTSLTVMR